MELFHGTSSGSVESIEESGILGSEGEDGRAWLTTRRDIAQKYGRDGAEGQGDGTYAVVVVDSAKIPKLRKEEFEGVWSASVVPKRAIIRIESYDANTGQKLVKKAYISPPMGALEITVIRDNNPRVIIAIDLGIPNFTVFSITLPLIEEQPQTMSQLIAEALHALCDEISTFMIAMQFQHEVIVQIYATILTCFKGMSNEADSDKKHDDITEDDFVKVFEGTFNIPMSFINETQEKVVTASGGKVVKKAPPYKRLELTYEKPVKPSTNDVGRIIREYRGRSFKTQPKPLFVVVYDQGGRPTGTIPIGRGSDFKNKLLQMTRRSSVEFTNPVTFENEHEMKYTSISGTPSEISIEGRKYVPEAMAGPEMALYRGEGGDYLVKFIDGRSNLFPTRPPLHTLRRLNYPIPTHRYRWRNIREEQMPTQGEEDGAESGIKQEEAPVDNSSSGGF